MLLHDVINCLSSTSCRISRKTEVQNDVPTSQHSARAFGDVQVQVCTLRGLFECLFFALRISQQKYLTLVGLVAAVRDASTLNLCRNSAAALLRP